ncbi:hypothetical protein, partial [Delftia acidovorans]|uniref:hypothetical protein n=1 Tax=Delftia acidovorans TaxID=80866 RepID=UPI0035A07813
MKRGQRIELSLDRPIGADHGVGPLYQPKAHDLLQRVGALQWVRKIEALVYQAAAQGCFVHQIISSMHWLKILTPLLAASLWTTAATPALAQ